MRVFLFSIIACLIGLSTTLYSDAIPWTSEEDRARAADSIAVGRIISYQNDGVHRYYEISIIKWIKNPQPDQTITMRSITPEAFNPHFPFAVFQKKDLGLFYLRLIDGKWQSTNYSRQILASELNDTIYNMKKLLGNNNPVTQETKTPFKQIQDGVAFQNVKCREGLELAYKKADDTSACVKISTMIELVIRGWAEDNRIILGCFGDRVEKCYPSDTKEYRKVLYEYYFGKNDDFPSGNFTKLQTINACTEHQICLGEFDNGTRIRVSCDYPVHSCGVRSFDNYTENRK
jgi:hypothetical protein